MSMARQALGFASPDQSSDVPYTVHGRLAGGAFGGVSFSDKGTLNLPFAK